MAAASSEIGNRRFFHWLVMLAILDQLKVFKDEMLEIPLRHLADLRSGQHALADDVGCAAILGGLQRLG